MIGIIGAMDIEIDNIKKDMKNLVEEEISNMNFYIGEFMGIKIVLGKCFEGKVNSAICTQTMILKYKVDCIINIGIAGALSKNLKIYDVVTANDTIQYDFDTSALGYQRGFVFGINSVKLKCDKKISNAIKSVCNEVILCTIGSADKFVENKKDKEEISNNFNDILAVDMESASICHTCNLNNIPFCSIRVISDSGNGIEFREFANKACNIIHNVIKLSINKVYSTINAQKN